MFSAVEIRSVIRFLVLKNYSTANIIEELRSVYQDECPSQSKQESRGWKFAGEERSRKLRSSAIYRKVLMLTIFWSHEGVVTMDYTEGSCNSAYYVDLLKKARKSKRKPRSEDLWLLQDNAPIHTSSQSTSTITTSGFNLLAHPPYSPDLAPSDFYLFSHLKKHLRGIQFNDKEQLMEMVDEFFSSKPTDFFENGFEQLVHRWRKCCEVNGSYIEG